MIGQFKEMLKKEDTNHCVFNLGVRKANEKAVEALEILLEKQSEEDIKNSHYFISYKGYDGGIEVVFGNTLIAFKETEKIKELERDITLFTLNLAKEKYPSVSNVHVLAFNKV